MNLKNQLPRRKERIINYDFPKEFPIFWGPNQLNPNGVYSKPNGWINNELLIVPLVARFITDAGSIDSDTADNTDGNPDPHDPDHTTWQLVSTSCHVDVSVKATLYPAGFGLQSPLTIWDKIERNGVCTEFYTGGLPSIPAGYSYRSGYILGAGIPRFEPSTPIILALQQRYDEYGNVLWGCVRIKDKDYIYNGSIAGAVAGDYMEHNASITTWFWTRPGPENTYTQWVNGKYFDPPDNTALNPDFVNMQWCYPGQPIYPSIP